MADNQDSDFFDRWDEHLAIMSQYIRPSPKHAIFCDSRGKYLDRFIKEANTSNINYQVFSRDGLSIKELIVKAEYHLGAFPRDYVYIFGGQCDITKRNRSTGVITCPWISQEALTTHLAAYTEVGLDWLHHYHPEANVVICPLTACDLSKRSANFFEGQQDIIDQAVQDFNKLVIEFNELSVVATPWTANHYFKDRNGNVEIKYHLLGTDGIHPTTDLLGKWAKDFVNCFQKKNLMLTHDSLY